MATSDKERPIFYTAGEAYIQTTACKWQTARNHLKGVIQKINSAISNGKFEIEIDKSVCTPNDIEYLRKHGYKYLTSKETGKFYDTISWKIDEI